MGSQWGLTPLLALVAACGTVDATDQLPYRTVIDTIGDPKERRYDVFERDGRYLGQVVAPRLLSAYVMKGDSIWGVIRDENDLPTVVKMRLDRPF